MVLPNLAPALAQVLMGRLTVGVAERSSQLWQVVLLVGASCALSWGVFLVGSLGRDERNSLFRSRRGFLSPEGNSGV